MNFKTKSIIVARKNRENESEGRPCFISMFDENDPHAKNISPKQILDFDNIQKIILKGFEVNYLLEGNDLVINNLTDVEIEQKPNGNLIVKGNQIL